MADDRLTATRRQALIAITTGLAAGAAPVAAAITRTTTTTRPAWDAAMAQLRRAMTQAEATATRLERVHAAYLRAQRRVPHVTVKRGSGAGFYGTLTTEEPRHVSYARKSVATVAYLEDLPGVYEDHRLLQEFIAAATVREAKISRIDRRLGYSALDKHLDAQWARVRDLEQVLLDMPAPDGQALMWKIENLYRPGEGEWAKGWEDQTHADLRRFLLGGRA